jgi:hypothetical protein
VTAPLPRDLIYEAMNAIQVGDRCVQASLFLLEAASSRHQEGHALLHALAREIAKGATVEALALALVYERQIYAAHSDDLAEIQADLDRIRDHIKPEVAAWSAFVKVRNYHARLADWKGRKPRKPKVAGKKTRRAVSGLTVSEETLLVEMLKDAAVGDVTWFFDESSPALKGLLRRGLAAMFTPAIGLREGVPYALTAKGRRDALAVFHEIGEAP